MLAQVHRSGLWLLLGAFALLGLFAMHGLGGHGAHQVGPSETHHASSDESPGAAHLTAHDCAGACAADGITAHPVLGSGSGGDDLLVMALCLAVLAAGAAVAAVLARGRPSLALLQPPRSAGGPAVDRSARDRDPPSIHALSVLRC